MKRVFALLGACAALGAFCVPASVQAAPAVATIALEENIIWGGGSTEQAIWGEIVLPVGTLMGYSVVSGNSVNIWAWIPGASSPILLAENIIWGG